MYPLRGTSLISSLINKVNKTMYDYLMMYPYQNIPNSLLVLTNLFFADSRIKSMVLRQCLKMCNLLTLSVTWGLSGSCEPPFFHL